MRLIRAALIAAMTLLAVAAQEAAPEPQPAAAAIAEQDLGFAVDATQGGRMFVMLGELAARQAGSAEVRRYAEQGVKEHKGAGEKLNSILTEIGLAVPNPVEDRTQALRDAMAELSGSDFDRQYVWHMVAAHTVAVNVFEEQIEEGRNPKLVGFAETAVETLRDHRDEATELWAQVK